MKLFGKNIPKWGVYGGIGAVVVGGVYLWKKHGTSSSSSGQTGTDPVTGLPYSEDNQTDPLTGLTYLAEAQQYGSVSAAEAALSGQSSALTAQEAAQQASELGTATATGNAGTVTTPVTGNGFASNSAWSQAAQEYLTGTVGLDPGTVSGALGVYLSGGTLNASQASIVQQALAAEGDPPVSGSNGYPPNLNTGSASQSGTGSNPSTPGSPGSSGGTPKSFSYDAPAGLRASDVTSTSALITWDAVSAAATSPADATKTPPTGYTIQVFQTNGKRVWNQAVTGTQTTVTGLHPSWTYHANVWANGGPVAPPHSTVTFTCSK